MVERERKILKQVSFVGGEWRGGEGNTNTSQICGSGV